MSGERVELEDGGYAILLEDEHGNIEITEYDSEAKAVRRAYGRSDKADAAEPPPSSDLPRADVVAARRNGPLQGGNHKHVKQARSVHPFLSCSGCGSTELHWFWFESPRWTWGLALCGTAGPMAWCDRCDRQVAYLEAGMS